MLMMIKKIECIQYDGVNHQFLKNSQIKYLTQKSQEAYTTFNIVFLDQIENIFKRYIVNWVISGGRRQEDSAYETLLEETVDEA